MAFPYSINRQFNYPMNMIGPYNMFMQNRIWKMFWYFLPTFICNSSNFIQTHFFIHHIAKEIQSIMATYCCKIQARLRIIISF
ncbi:MAG TPA: hypothetical protein DCM62_06940 [Bacteroidales bacterium]|nr:hypothetical protein [Bacteroidales bacterium]